MSKTKKTLGLCLACGALLLSCGATDDGSEETGAGTGSTSSAAGGTGGTSSDADGGTGDETGGTPPAPNGGTDGAADCLEEDGPDTLGAGGGSCEGSRCGSTDTLTYHTCLAFWDAARTSVFYALRNCIEGTTGYCDSQEATVTACIESVLPTACEAPGVTVDGTTLSCSELASSCAEFDEEECSQLMSALDESHRQGAYECYVAADSSSDCGVTLRDCVGLTD